MTMIEGKLSSLVDVLLEKSREGKVSWKPTARSNEFLWGFSKYAVSIRQTSERFDSGHIYSLSIVNESGEEIETLIHNANSPDHKIVQEMFILARRSANNVEESLDNLLQELQSI